MGAGASAAVPEGELTKEQAMACAGDKWSEDAWQEKTFGMGNLSREDWDALVKVSSTTKPPSPCLLPQRACHRW